jgi:uncharacterized protein YecT (DUF1311 family)
MQWHVRCWRKRTWNDGSLSRSLTRSGPQPDGNLASQHLGRKEVCYVVSTKPCWETIQMISKPNWSQSPKQTIKIIVLGLACFIGTSVAAESNRELSQEYSTCLDKANGVTFAMIDCIAAETSRQDIQLNENYKRLTSKISPKRKQGLLDAQRAWMNFRDANCKFYADPRRRNRCKTERHRMRSKRNC